MSPLEFRSPVSLGRRALTAVVASLALVAALAVGTTMASGSDAVGQTAASGPSTGGGPGSPIGHGFPGAVLHGTYVVTDPDGGYRTVVTQRGEVTAVSGTSLTLRSTDGFVATYRLSDGSDGTDGTRVLGGTGGVRDIATGDAVGVSAEREGAVNTATHVADLGRMVDPRRNHPDLPGPR